MRLKFFRVQIFLLSMISGMGIISNGYGGSVTHHVRSALKVVHEAAHPFRKNMGCYGACTEKTGRQGSVAFQTYCRQYEGASLLRAISLLEGGRLAETPDTLREAQRAVSCLKGCPLSMTVRFMAQFLGSMEDKEAVRAVGILLGLSPDLWGVNHDPFRGVQQKGHDTKLFAVVFNNRFHQSCDRVLRHKKEKIKIFHHNLGILRQVFFELYGPVPKVEEYRRLVLLP